MFEKKYVPDVTLCITMGGRPDLLERSLLSIDRYYHFPHVVAINDFLDDRCDEVFLKIFPQGKLISDGIKRGHHGAIDRLYEEVVTPYVFHTEDDWEFHTPIDFEKLKNFLAENKGVTSYCFRDVNSFLKPDDLKKINKESFNGIDYLSLSKVHEEWYFYTFNPHLILKNNIEKVGKFVDFKKERHVSRFFKKNGKHVAYASPGVCEHIGDGQSVANPNANKKKSRLRVWIRKQINKFKSIFHTPP